jgi:hypothetical protein
MAKLTIKSGDSSNAYLSRKLGAYIDPDHARTNSTLSKISSKEFHYRGCRNLRAQITAHEPAA